MGDNLMRVLHEQQQIIEQQSRLIADLAVTLESWEDVAGYEGTELKGCVESLRKRKGGTYGNGDYEIY